jgi:hypothetical protein
VPSDATNRRPEPRAAAAGPGAGYTNLIPITSPFFQATLQVLPGDARSNFS